MLIWVYVQFLRSLKLKGFTFGSDFGERFQFGLKAFFDKVILRRLLIRLSRSELGIQPNNCKALILYTNVNACFGAAVVWIKPQITANKGKHYNVAPLSDVRPSNERWKTFLKTQKPKTLSLRFTGRSFCKNQILEDFVQRRQQRNILWLEKMFVLKYKL